MTRISLRDSLHCVSHSRTAPNILHTASSPTLPPPSPPSCTPGERWTQGKAREGKGREGKGGLGRKGRKEGREDAERESEGREGKGGMGGKEGRVTVGKEGYVRKGR